MFAAAPTFEKYGNRAEARQAAAGFHNDPPMRYYLTNPLWSSVFIDGDAVPDETLSVQVISTDRVSASSKTSEVRRLFDS